MSSIAFDASYIVDPELFSTVASEIGVEWTQLAGKLDANIDTDVIIQEKNYCYDRAMAFLKRWYRKDPSLATVHKLMNALIVIGRRDIANLIGKIYALTSCNVNQAGYVVNRYTAISYLIYRKFNIEIKSSKISYTL